MMGFRFKRQDALLIVLAAIVVGVYAVAGGGGFPLDDSWIHQTYGRNLAQYGEWAFVPGQPSAASTSPLYTVLLSMGYRLNIPFFVWTHLLGIVAFSIAAITGSRLAARMLPNSKYAPLMTGLALIFTWHLSWAAASGMETMLAGMFPLVLIALVLPLTTQPDTTTRQSLINGLIFGVVAALSTLTRPEQIMMVGMIGLLMLLARPQGTRAFVLWTVGAATGFLVCIAPYLILNLRLTGGLLPNTAAAKFAEFVAFLAAPYPVRVQALFIAIIAGGQFLLIPGMVAFVWYMLKRTTPPGIFARLFYLLPLMWAVALIALYAARLPADYQHGRYVIPALPGLIVPGVVGTVELMRRARYQMATRVLTRALVGAALLSYAFFVIQGVAIYRVDIGIIDGEMVNAAYWIRDHLPPDELLVTHDIGAVGYFAPRDMLDIAGLISPEVIPVITNPDAVWALMQEHGGRYLLAFPSQVPGGNLNDPRLCPIYTTNAAVTLEVGEKNMSIYRLAWDGKC